MILFSFLNRCPKKASTCLAGAFLLVCLILPAALKAEFRGIILAGDKGEVIFSENMDRPLVPASTIKLLTSLAALKGFGQGYRFTTWAAFDEYSQTLFIKGFGDPLLISEELHRFCTEAVAHFHLTRVTGIVLDHTFFHPDILIPGTGNSKNPYDATTGALCANFNTVHFKKAAGSNTYVSAEAQTPLLDQFQNQLKTTGLSHGRMLLEPSQRQHYAGWLLRHFLDGLGVTVTGTVETGTFPENIAPMVFKSGFTLPQVIEKLLSFSNNFIANQLLLSLGANAYGPPATLEKGLLAVRAYAKRDLGLDDFTLVEGSGLSRQNRISPRQLLKVVTAFKPHINLMKTADHEFYKTGTLSDVRARAGFFAGEKERLYPFVIMINDTTRGYGRILKELKQKALAADRKKENNG